VRGVLGLGGRPSAASRSAEATPGSVSSWPKAVPARAPACGTSSMGARARLAWPDLMRLFDVLSLRMCEIRNGGDRGASLRAPDLGDEVVDGVPGERGVGDGAPPAELVRGLEEGVRVQVVRHGDLRVLERRGHEADADLGADAERARAGAAEGGGGGRGRGGAGAGAAPGAAGAVVVGGGAGEEAVGEGLDRRQQRDVARGLCVRILVRSECTWASSARTRV
jgi:hypothetical protein